MYIGKIPTVGNFQICDAITVVDAQAAYTMQVDTVDVSPESANHMIVSLNGVIQKPTDAYTVSGSTITFASNLVTGDVIDFIQILGNVLDLGVPSDATVTTAKIVDANVTAAKMFSGFANGITEADQWRLTATLTLTGDDTTAITANLERNDTAGFSKIGTGMTQSSGVFTFPSTGIYEIYAFGNFYSSGNMAYARVGIQTTTDNGSSYTLQSAANTHVNATYYNISTNNFIFDVTNTSTHKVKFTARHENNGNLEANTAANVTWFSFKKLGDT
jgi:hypothetical protein